jgi:hypothetical protein
MSIKKKWVILVLVLLLSVFISPAWTATFCIDFDCEYNGNGRADNAGDSPEDAGVWQCATVSGGNGPFNSLAAYNAAATTGNTTYITPKDDGSSVNITKTMYDRGYHFRNGLNQKNSTIYGDAIGYGTMRGATRTKFSAIDETHSAFKQHSGPVFRSGAYSLAVFYAKTYASSFDVEEYWKYNAIFKKANGEHVWLKMNSDEWRSGDPSNIASGEWACIWHDWIPYAFFNIGEDPSGGALYILSAAYAFVESYPGNSKHSIHLMYMQNPVAMGGCEQVSFEDSIIEYCAYGMQLGGRATPDYCSIAGNTIRYCNLGISVGTDSPYSEGTYGSYHIASNVIHGCTKGINVRTGLSTGASNQLVVDGNTMFNNTEHDIMVENGFGPFIVYGHFSHNIATTKLEAGFSSTSMTTDYNTNRGVYAGSWEPGENDIVLNTGE